MNIYQESGLKTLCANAEQGMALNKFLTEADKTSFKVRTGGPKGKNKNEWFDREYLRYEARLSKHKNISDDYTIVFAKPGIGFYACIVTHKNYLITSAWFEDNAD